MIVERFDGASGKRRLQGILQRTSLTSGNPGVCQEFVERGELIKYLSSDFLIRQGGADNYLLILISGKTNIMVNNKLVAIREAPSHIGEMSLVNPKEKRSAHVIAITEVVALKITEEVFTDVASKFPFLWRNIAIELADRLKQRGSLLKAPNEVPNLFIGCSVENLPLAREIQQVFDYDSFGTKIWTEQIFKPSGYALDDLIEEVKSSDYAIFLLLDEDSTISRGTEYLSPRDNVVFELGLFIGRLGRERTFIVCPRSLEKELKLPTDLLGLKVLSYNDKRNSLTPSIGPVCSEIRKVVARLGPI